MSRLIVFGCSYTYGQGLSDCLNSKFLDIYPPFPSKLGWAQQLADKLNLELINKSYPSASNFEILFTLLEFKFQSNDTVIIMWSHYLRDMMFTRWFKSLFFRRRLGLWKKNAIARRWIDQMSEQDYAMKTWVYMHHAGLYLENINLKYIHYPADPWELEKYHSNDIKLNNLYKNGFICVDKALDNMHPGLLSNKLVSENMYQIINSMSS